MKTLYKNFIIVFLIIVILLILTFFNKYIVKNNNSLSNNLYKNSLSNIIRNNDLNEIDALSYDEFKSDLDDIDIILKEQLQVANDIKTGSSYYKIAANVYDHKITELVRALNEKLNDEDFERLQNEINELERNIESAISGFSSTIESTIELEYYSNKYMYEERQNECHKILETYKGFLK